MFTKKKYHVSESVNKYRIEPTYAAEFLRHYPGIRQPKKAIGRRKIYP